MKRDLKFFIWLESELKLGLSLQGRAEFSPKFRLLTVTSQQNKSSLVTHILLAIPMHGTNIIIILNQKKQSVIHAKWNIFQDTVFHMQYNLKKKDIYATPHWVPCTGNTNI